MVVIVEAPLLHRVQVQVVVQGFLLVGEANPENAYKERVDIDEWIILIYPTSLIQFYLSSVPCTLSKNL